jgi:putative oxidoreductase
MNIGLLLLRVVLGLTMASHGAQKLFGTFGGAGLRQTGAFFESIGLRPGHVHAPLAGLLEFGGGVLMALGLVTPLAAAAITGVMTVAILTVHIPKGFFASGGGYEYPLLIVGAAIAVACIGPGAYSIDHALGLTLSGGRWGAAALAAGIIGGGLVALTRRPPQPGQAPPART